MLMWDIIETSLIAIITTVILVVISVLLGFWIGWLFGWLTKVIFGNLFVYAWNTAFGTAITADIIPWIGATFGWISGIFIPKNSNSNLNKK